MNYVGTLPHLPHCFGQLDRGRDADTCSFPWSLSLYLWIGDARCSGHRAWHYSEGPELEREEQ